MTLVVDASVAVKFLVLEDGWQEARRLIADPGPLIAPDWIVPEVANAMWKKVARKELLEADALANLDVLPEFFVALAPARELLRDAYRRSFALKHAVYDCIYLELAMRETAKLVTADEKFVASATRGGLGEHVVLLA